MGIARKHIIAGAIGLVSITAALLYLQYKRLMNYVIKLGGVKINNASPNSVNMDLTLNFTNNSDLNFEILEQDYTAYINDNQVTKAVNYSSNSIAAKSTSPIQVNIKFNPSKIFNLVKSAATDFVLHPDRIKITVVVKLKVKLYGIKFSIPYTYEDTLRGILDARKASVAQKQTKS